MTEEEEEKSGGGVKIWNTEIIGEGIVWCR